MGLEAEGKLNTETLNHCVVVDITNPPSIHYLKGSSLPVSVPRVDFVVFDEFEVVLITCSVYI